MVGADGGQSWVRAQCDIGIDYRPYGQRAVVANFSMRACRTMAPPTSGSRRPEGIVALLPLPGNQVSLVWSAPDALADTLMQEPLSQLAERLSALPRQPFGTLRRCSPKTSRTCRWR